MDLFNQKKFDKKATSSFLSVVLMMAVAILLSTLILGWLSCYSEDGLNDANLDDSIIKSCHRLDFQILKIELNDYNLKKQLVETNNTKENYNVSIKVHYENNGREDLAGLIIKGLTDIDGEIIKDISFSSPLKSYKRSSYANIGKQFNCINESCKITRIIITPKVKVDINSSKTYSCDELKLDFLRSDSVVHIINS